jgi:hypothetical protein
MVNKHISSAQCAQLKKGLGNLMLEIIKIFVGLQVVDSILATFNMTMFSPGFANVPIHLT